MQTIYEIKGQLKGPTVTIMGGIHGNEFCGVEAIQSLVSDLKIKRGKLNLIIANPLAIEKDVRAVNVNMNRIFLDEIDSQIKDTYEYQRSLEIRKFLDDSDILLDIHSSGPDSQPFVITEQNGIKYIQNLNFELVLTGIDAFHPGSTDGYMYNNGKVGICIECGYMRDKNSSNVAIQAVIDFLIGLDMLDGENLKSRKSKQIFASKLIYKSQTNDFKLVKKFTDFDFVPQGTVIGFDGGKPISFEKDYYILFSVNQFQKNQECFLLVNKN